MSVWEYARVYLSGGQRGDRLWGVQEHGCVCIHAHVSPCEHLCESPCCV